MAQSCPEEEKQQITKEANDLLLKLTQSCRLLQKLNADIEARPFSSRIHGQFDGELKKSQRVISKLSTLLRTYHAFEFTSTFSLQLHSEHTASDSPKPIDPSFVYQFKDICLQIGREWRIGTRLINDFYAEHGPQSQHDETDTNYHSDNDIHYYRHKNRRESTRQSTRNSKSARSTSSCIEFGCSNRKRSGSCSPMHSFSNPNSHLFAPRAPDNGGMSKSVTITRHAMPSLNIGVSQSQILQQKEQRIHSNDSEYHSKIGKEFEPYYEEEALNKQIRDIADDLQYLMEISEQVNDLVDKQGDDINDMEKHVESSKENVEQGMDTLTAIRKSPYTYAIAGGLTFAAIGAPFILVGAGLKAAVGGALGLGTVGAVGGGVYANKSNESMDAANDQDKKQRLLQQESENKQKGIQRQNARGFQTQPRKRKPTQTKTPKSTRNTVWNDGSDDDDEEDIDPWDARN